MQHRLCQRKDLCIFHPVQTYRHTQRRSLIIWDISSYIPLNKPLNFFLRQRLFLLLLLDDIKHAHTVVHRSFLYAFLITLYRIIFLNASLLNRETVFKQKGRMYTRPSYIHIKIKPELKAATYATRFQRKSIPQTYQ